jgi:tetrahydromethanopterin S-methyltransferase subunit G
MDRLRKEIDSIQKVKHNTDKHKEHSKFMDDMTMKIEGIIHLSSDELINKLNRDVDIIKSNDNMITMMIMMKELVSLDWTQDFVQVNKKLGEILKQMENEKRFKL